MYDVDLNACCMVSPRGAGNLHISSLLNYTQTNKYIRYDPACALESVCSDDVTIAIVVREQSARKQHGHGRSSLWVWWGSKSLRTIYATIYTLLISERVTILIGERRGEKALDRSHLSLTHSPWYQVSGGVNIVSRWRSTSYLNHYVLYIQGCSKLLEILA